jgi:hypothetical protein
MQRDDSEVTLVSPRRWTDLSFLDIHPPEAQVEGNCGLRETQISFVISGSDNSRWTAYAFVDTDFDDDLEDESDGAFSTDLLASNALDANLPIWDPREYFLRVFSIRITEVRRQWDSLIRKVGRSMGRYVCYPRFFALWS